MSPASAPAVLLLSLLTALVPAQQGEPVRLLEDFSLSPDGQTIAFSWRGDLWSVSSNGGAITRLTAHPDSDAQPCFSPDGSRIAFVSTRDQGRQVYVMPAAGGAPKRITTHTDGHELREWTPDGEALLVRASRDHYWRDAGRHFIQGLDGKKAPRLLFDGHGEEGTLSPDGRQLLFTREGTRVYRKGYYGAQASQVWHLDLQSGKFTKLAAEKHGSRYPLWAPDGRTWYWVSQESGTWNLHRTRLGSDGSEQLTSFEDDGVLFPAISRDGSTIVFNRLFDLYRMDTKSGKVTRLDIRYAGDPTVETMRREEIKRANHVAFTDDAREIAFTAGGDLWVMDTELREPRRVTETPEEERDPVFTPDHKTLIFVSDHGGSTDLWAARPKDAKKAFWDSEEFVLTRLTDDPATESAPRIYHDGKRIAFVRGRGDLFTMDISGGDVQQVIKSWNRPAYDFSPDGKWIVYSVQDDNYNHDVWIKPLDGSREPYNVSVHPDNDRNPKWSPAGDVIAFTGRRWGEETDIVYVRLVKEEDEETSRQRRLEKAMKKMKGRKKGSAKPGKKTSGGDKPKAAMKAASGDAITGLWRGQLSGPPPIPPEGMEFEAQLKLEAGGRITGSMSSALGDADISEGRYVATTGAVRLTADFGDVIVEVTGTMSGNRGSGKWTSPMGNGTWTLEREGASKKPAVARAAGKKKDDAKGKKAVRVDFEGLRDRLRRLRIPNSRESGLIWSPDGKKLGFRATAKGKSGMHTIEFPDKMTPKFVTTSIPSSARWLSEGKQLVGMSGGSPASMSASGKMTRYSFTVKTEVQVAPLMAAIFDQAWRTMRDGWYDDRLGNNNWDAIRRKYGEGAAACLDAGDLSKVSNRMLGELNGSHLGFSMGRGRRRGPAAPSTGSSTWRVATGHLGARFDRDWKGPGLKIKDVVRDTPAWREDSRLRAGEIILTIDGKTVDPDMDIALAMTGRTDREVELLVKGLDDKERKVTIRPTSYGAVRSRLYEDWIRRNQARVEELSNGQLGYLHIRGMGGTNLLRFDTELYRVGYGKKGLVIDVRENGGGSITDHLLTCLCQPTHAITRARGGGEGYPHDRRIYATWDKPIIVLCNQNSFSNAEIFSHSIKTLGRGQVVGVPTAGGVISTGGSSLYAGKAFVRMPFRGWHLMDGEDMELNGCVPHHVIWPHPTEIPSGKDRQLDKAVAELIDDVAKWEKRPQPELKKATERN